MQWMLQTQLFFGRGINIFPEFPQPQTGIKALSGHSMWRGHQPELPLPVLSPQYLSPGDPISAQQEQNFPTFRAISSPPGVFSQYFWQQLLVNLCFQIWSNFTEKKKKKKGGGSLPCFLDICWVPRGHSAPPPEASGNSCFARVLEVSPSHLHPSPPSRQLHHVWDPHFFVLF